MYKIKKLYIQNFKMYVQKMKMYVQKMKMYVQKQWFCMYKIKESNQRNYIYINK